METDVVILGGGGSGLSAAIAAAEAGARVVLLEKNAQLGGTTACSVGSISSTGTPHQRRLGIVDDPQAHFEDMALFQGKDGVERSDNDALRRILTENIPETFRWLESIGIVFFGPNEEAPHRYPRMHNVMPNSGAYIYHLERCARRCGVEIWTNARAQRFITDDGEVIGVELQRSGQQEQVYARKAVVLASGDYAGDPEFRRQYMGDAVAKLQPVNPTNTGDGHRMAIHLGAQIVHPDAYSGGMRFVRPSRQPWISRLPPSKWLMRCGNLALRWAPPAIVRRILMSFLTTVLVPSPKLYAAGAIIINKNGERFADETKGMPFNLSEQPGAAGYILFDGAIAEKFSKWPHYVSTAPGFAYAYLQDYQRNRPDLFHQADTLEELARELGIPEAKLTDTIEAYNHSNRDKDCGNGLPPRADRAELTRGPWFALGPCHNYIHYTDGGLAINENFQILDEHAAPIPRLFAAGNAGQGGALLRGHGHHLGWAFTSGRLAGRLAASVDPRARSSLRQAADPKEPHPAQAY